MARARAGARVRARVLRHVVHLLLPEREAVDVLDLDTLPHLEPRLMLLELLPLKRCRLALPIVAHSAGDRVGDHDLLLAHLAEQVLDEALDPLGLTHLAHLQ